MEISYERRIWVPSACTRLRFQGLVIDSPPLDVGGFYSIAYMGAYDHILDRISSEDVVVDGGANIGVFSLLAARKARCVYAVEPHPDNFKFLRRNIELNHLDNIIPVNAALGPLEGSVRISGGGESVRIQRDGFPVPMTTIDRISNKQATVIKMDVEGYEVAALMTQDTRQTARLIAVEMDRGNLQRINQDPALNYGVTATYEELATVLEKDGYTLTRQNELRSNLFEHLKDPWVLPNEIRTFFFGLRSLLFPYLLHGKNLLSPQAWTDDQYFFWMLYAVRE